MAHQKHPPLTRPQLGHYARAEFALVGTTCARMDGLMRKWQQELSGFNVLTVIGDHGTPQEVPLFQTGTKQFTGGPSSWNEYDDRLQGRQSDLALVNGNHYPASRQIVFVDPNKAGTLERRRAQLTDVAAVVLCPGADELPAWLDEHLGGGAQGAIADSNRVQCELGEAEQTLLPLLSAAATKAIPTLKALVLAGGKSSRMGENKGQLVYRQQTTEVQRMVALCQSCGLDTYLSVADATDLPDTTANGHFADRFIGLGPLGAISTALLQDPDAAWLVLPCDLPLFEANTLERLIAARDHRKVATAIKAAEKPFPEPLATIYEPRAYPRLLEFLSLGYACPRKMLINSDVAHLEIEDTTPITNANTPEEKERVKQLLGQ